MEIYTVSYRKKKKASAFADAFGGEDATRTHNALRHTTFPMWLLTIRIPLRVALDYYSKHFSKKQEGFFIFLKNFFAPAKRGAGGPPILSGWGGR